MISLREDASVIRERNIPAAHQCQRQLSSQPQEVDTRDNQEFTTSATHIHNKEIAGLHVLRQARVPVSELEPPTERSCGSQGRFSNHCATDAPYLPKHTYFISSYKTFNLARCTVSVGLVMCIAADETFCAVAEVPFRLTEAQLPYRSVRLTPRPYHWGFVQVQERYHLGRRTKNKHHYGQ
ncbi:hypothetical protein PoB_000970800 [Plakobranchus ocellatus]|uniref:Uncharacterized protein n=1 Tax=Plakobranchus ocellatus TaxID=259542 RepID=A0AAV3YLH6_9GAST|nr:hypothetical protein PoB_000970800 [Plakobranchus ocellatus]